jgi:ketosteroid isomerase-like protein
MNHQLLLDAVKKASEGWKASFNRGDAQGCASFYEENAIMNASPLGSFHGKQEIEQFWKKLIDDHFSEVEYIDPKIEIIDDVSATITGNWKMNKAHGVLHEEYWVVQSDGSAKLRRDHFEILS